MEKVKGLVFRNIPFGESSLILQVFTLELGLQSFLWKGAKKARSKNTSPAQALNPVELVAYPPKTGDLYLVKEIKAHPVYQNIPFHILKTSMVLFLDEVLIKSIRHHQKDPALFDFISNALSWLDISTGALANYHILFLMQLSRYLGFHPSLEHNWEIKEDIRNEKIFFDLKNGIFLDKAPYHNAYIGYPNSLHLLRLWNLNFESGESYRLDRKSRLEILEILIDYYRFHIDGFGIVKSLEVLTQVFDENE